MSPFDVIAIVTIAAMAAGLKYRANQIDRLDARIRAARIELNEAMLREGTPTGSNCVLRAYAALGSDRSADIVNKAFPEST